jgi:hypothetical protein
MFALVPHGGHHPRMAARRAGVRLRRLAAVLAAVVGGLLASAATIPAAFAMVVPDPGGLYGTARPAPTPATVRVITAGGMPGWQITVIAIGAALFAAAAAVLLDRALTGRRQHASASAA